VTKFPARQRAVVAALRAARIKAGLSQRQLSDALKESTTHIHLIESLRRSVRVEEFIEIAKTLDVDPIELLKDVLRR
jgi:transcriptional regulator with XRE-family HTH domain